MGLDDLLNFVVILINMYIPIQIGFKSDSDSIVDLRSEPFEFGSDPDSKLDSCWI